MSDSDRQRAPGRGDRGTVPALARAVPAFTQQTGQPCTACHVDAFGPQLTPFGQAFKISRYTQTGGDGQTPVPLALMLLGSYSNTTKGQGAPAAPNYGSNGNFAMNQISVFLAGRINDYAGGFVQVTLDGIASAFYLDNTDLPRHRGLGQTARCHGASANTMAVTLLRQRSAGRR